jgi:hypothetical protein
VRKIPVKNRGYKKPDQDAWRAGMIKMGKITRMSNNALILGNFWLHHSMFFIKITLEGSLSI